ncbi:MAG: hypothetical protein LIO59_03125, partial [Oscillospiraceae bacterium]|nr:hypothetical protein [Oscillospiraceae bacterium]
DKIKTGEDAARVYPYLLETESMYFMKQQYLYHYRHSDVQMTVTYDKDAFERFKSLYNFFNNSNLAKSDYSGQLDYYYYYLVKTLISNELKRKNKISFGNKIRNIHEIVDFAKAGGFIDKINPDEFSWEHKIYFKLLKSSHIVALSLCIKIAKLFQKFFR